MTDNPNFSPYVVEALKRAELPIIVMPLYDCIVVSSNGRFGVICETVEMAKYEYINRRTRLLREQQQVK